MLDVSSTLLSQFANSTTLRRMIEDMNDAIDPRADIQAFYDRVFNVNTAVGIGLDWWGRIVGVPRLLQIPASGQTLGFHNANIPPDWAPFNQGTWFSGANITNAYRLPDDAYRLLILIKALANITATTAPALNKLLRNLFPGRGTVYVRDNGGMSMTFVFQFSLSAAEYAILTLSGVVPHPAGVGFNVIAVPDEVFGFGEAAALGDTVEPFDSAPFYVPAGT